MLFRVLQGLGGGALVPVGMAIILDVTAAAMVSGLSSLPPQLLSQGTAVRLLTSQVGGRRWRVAVLGAVVASQMGVDPTPAEAQAAYNSAFMVAAAGMVLAAAMPGGLPARSGGPRPRPRSWCSLPSEDGRGAERHRARPRGRTVRRTPDGPPGSAAA